MMEQSYSEMSCLSLGNDSDHQYCKGIDYNQLKLPKNHTLKHLIIRYLVKKTPRMQGIMLGN